MFDFGHIEACKYNSGEVKSIFPQVTDLHIAFLKQSKAQHREALKFVGSEPGTLHQYLGLNVFLTFHLCESEQYLMKLSLLPTTNQLHFWKTFAEKVVTGGEGDSFLKCALCHQLA